MDKFMQILKLKQFWFYFSTFCVITLFVIFAFFDLDISTSIVNENSRIAIFMENFGMIISPLITMLSGVVCSEYYKKYDFISNRNTKILLSQTCILFSLIICAIILSYYSYNPLITVILVLFIPTIQTYARNCAMAKLKYLFKVAFMAIFYVITFLSIVQILKIMWGRVRFRDLNDVVEYSRWYVIQGINGHKSFPSGHTANAMSILLITLINPILYDKSLRIFNWVFACGWILLMSYCRVIIGAHYCSDVLFSIVLGVIWFHFSKAFVTKSLVISRQKYIIKLEAKKIKNN